MRFMGKKDFNSFLFLLEGVGYNTTPLLEYMKELKKGDYLSKKEFYFYYDKECIMCVIERREFMHVTPTIDRIQISLWQKEQKNI